MTMLPHDIPGLIGYWKTNSAHYKSNIWKNPIDAALFNGFEDLSGYNNPLVVRSGTPAYETRDGREGVFLDDTLLLTCLCPNAYDGTILLVYEDGVTLNTTRFIATFEDFDQTTTRTSTPNYYMARRGLGVSSCSYFGGQSSDLATNSNTLGTGGGDRIVHILAPDQGRAQVTQRVNAGADVDNATSTTAATSPKGPDLVLGRVTLLADASRVALTGVNRFWLREVMVWDSNLPKDSTSLLAAYVTELLA